MSKHENKKDIPVLVLAGGMAVLGVGVSMLSQPMYKAIAGRNLPVSDTPVYNAGTYEGTARGYGGDVTVTVTLTEYGIDDITVSAPDETPEIGQAAAVQLSKEIWRNQSHSVDSVSGATMTSNAVKKATAHCIREAVKEGTELAEIIAKEIEQENSQAAMPELSELLAGTPDGDYIWVDAESDENGFFNRIDLTVEDHKITGLVWDAVNAEETGKRQLSADGQYTMTENGPLWYEQADALAQYVMEKQSTSGLMNDAGTSDTVASVSIHVGGFVESVKKCLLLASGNVSEITLDELLAQAEDGAYSYLSDPDEKGFCESIELEVADHKITSLVWDAVNAEGTGKREMSSDGRYVMTEDGPAWYEQADALADYVVENQSEEGLLDESGYASDAIASVSIYSGGFLNAVKACLAEGK